jgi:retron-type reverse transcriptase
LSKIHNDFDSCFSKIITEENFDYAYHRTQKTNTKYSQEALNFSADLTYNLDKLRTELIERCYQPGEYNIFTIHEPKTRVIAAPKYRDKIVQFAIHNVINNDFERKFIKDSYACQKGKGTHAAADRIQHFLRKAKWKWGKAWIVKADIKSFFYSIKHHIIKNILAKKIKCQEALNLLYKIIDNSPDSVGLPVSEYENELYYYDFGLPLGNVTSQLLANLYLNELDQFCKRKLSLKLYARYMDDFVAIIKTKEKAKEIKRLMTQFVNEKLDLKMNQRKTKIFPLKQGVNMVGYKIWTTHRLLRNSSKKRIKQKLSKFKRLLIEGKITKEKVEQILNSWKGHADHACSENFYSYLENRFDYICRNQEGVFKVKNIKEAA